MLLCISGHLSLCGTEQDVSFFLNHKLTRIAIFPGNFFIKNGVYIFHDASSGSAALHPLWGLHGVVFLLLMLRL